MKLFVMDPLCVEDYTNEENWLDYQLLLYLMNKTSGLGGIKVDG